MAKIAEDFDFGAEPVEAGGGNFKNPDVGPHTARLRSLIHVGMFEGEFKGKKKPPAPTAIAIFELKDENDFEEDGETPLIISKDFPIKKGDKAFMTKLLGALDPKGTAKGFDDLIGAPCTVEVVANEKELNEDGTPKYVNFGSISAIPAQFAKHVTPLAGLGVGHVRFDEMTVEALMELHPIRHVHRILMKSQNYGGSKAEQLVAEVRKENPDFAKPKEKDEKDKPKGKGGAGNEMPAEQMAPPPNLTEDEEF